MFGGTIVSSSTTYMLTRVVCLFHEEEQKHKGNGSENTGPVEYPLPAVVLCNEAADNGCKVVASGQKTGVEAYIRSAFMGEILNKHLLDSSLTAA